MGRPPVAESLTDQVRIKTRNGKELIDFYWRVFNNRRADLRDRLEAAKRLEDRGWGKPTQVIEVSGSVDVTYRERFAEVMADPEVAQLARTFAERLLSTDGPGATNTH